MSGIDRNFNPTLRPPWPGETPGPETPGAAAPVQGALPQDGFDLQPTGRTCAGPRLPTHHCAPGAPGARSGQTVRAGKRVVHSERNPFKPFGSASQVISQLQEAKNLRILALNLRNVTDLDDTTLGHIIQLCPESQFLDISYQNSITNLDSLANLANLTTLRASSCEGLLNVDGLARFTSLDSVYLDACAGLQNVDGLRNLEQAKKIDLRCCTGLHNIEGLTKLREVKEITLGVCTGLRDINALSNLRSADIINLSYCTSLRAIPQWILSWDRPSLQIQTRGIPFSPETLVVLNAVQRGNPNIGFHGPGFVHTGPRDDIADAFKSITISREGNVFESARRAYAYCSATDYRIPPFVRFGNANEETFEVGVDAGGLRKDFLNLVARSFFAQHFVTGTDGRGHAMPSDLEALRDAGRFTAMAYNFDMPLPFELSQDKWHAASDSYESLLAGYKAVEPEAAQHLPDHLKGQGLATMAEQIGEGDSDSDAQRAACMAFLHERLAMHSNPEHHTETFVNAARAFWGGMREVLGDEKFEAFIHDPKRHIRLSGDARSPDVEQWEQHTYVQSFSEDGQPSKSDHEVADAFWKVVAQLDGAQRLLLLELVTGYVSVPEGGFAALKPNFALKVGLAAHHLPVAHTCFNQLDLPNCPDIDVMQQRIAKFLEWQKTEASRGFYVA